MLLAGCLAGPQGLCYDTPPEAERTLARPALTPKRSTRRTYFLLPAERPFWIVPPSDFGSTGSRVFQRPDGHTLGWARAFPQRLNRSEPEVAGQAGRVPAWLREARNRSERSYPQAFHGRAGLSHGRAGAT